MTQDPAQRNPHKPIQYFGFAFHGMKLDSARQLQEALILYAEKRHWPPTHVLMNADQRAELGQVDGVVVEASRSIPRNEIWCGEALSA